MNTTTATTKWQDRFLSLAYEVARWSKDPSSKVGAVIVEPSNRNIIIGYNGPPRNVADHVNLPRERRLLRSLHAEQNAIITAKRELTGWHIYTTHTPCAKCTAMIIQAGITHIITHTPQVDFALRWEEDISEAKQMCYEADVTLIWL